MAQRSKRNLTKRLSINGRLIEATTIKGFADMVGKSRDTLDRYEELGYIQGAPLKSGNYRYYPVSLINRLKPLLEQFPCNKKPDATLIAQINFIFNDERNKLCQKQEQPQTPQ